jgi:hypothetical protein
MKEIASDFLHADYSARPADVQIAVSFQPARWQALNWIMFAIGPRLWNFLYQM